jgi:hypothetical protein
LDRRTQKRLTAIAEAALAAGNSERALACFEQVFRASRGVGRRVREELCSAAKLRHDIEQIEFLVASGRLPEPALGRLERYRMLERSLGERRTARARRSGLHPVAMTPEMRRLVGPEYNRDVHGTWPSRVRGRAIHPALDGAAAAKKYRDNGGLVVLDDLLTPRALTALRRHCLESTIWYHPRPGGYLCAYLHDGFASGLVFQIAEELRQRLAPLLAEIPLLTAWAYKYERAHPGLGLHADKALVNVNLWITPDRANLDTRAGGLVVHDAPVPASWSLEDYNLRRNAPKMRRWLRGRTHRELRIPYRDNRAVVFDSAFLHHSDRGVFAPGYENRRVNVTFLYGSRAIVGRS